MGYLTLMLVFVWLVSYEAYIDRLGHAWSIYLQQKARHRSNTCPSKLEIQRFRVACTRWYLNTCRVMLCYYAWTGLYRTPFSLFLHIPFHHASIIISVGVSHLGRTWLSVLRRCTVPSFYLEVVMQHSTSDNVAVYFNTVSKPLIP